MEGGRSCASVLTTGLNEFLITGLNAAPPVLTDPLRKVVCLFNVKG
jgi:hypothetical protein